MDSFKEDLDKSLNNRNFYEYIHFQDKFARILNKHATFRENNTVVQQY